MGDSRGPCLRSWDQHVELNVHYTPLVKYMHTIQLFRIRHICFDNDDCDSLLHESKSMNCISFLGSNFLLQSLKIIQKYHCQFHIMQILLISHQLDANTCKENGILMPRHSKCGPQALTQPTLQLNQEAPLSR
jgi:hypothetical protein